MNKDKILHTIEFISNEMKIMNDRPHILFGYLPVIIVDGQITQITEENKKEHISRIISYMKQADSIGRIFVHIQKPYYLYVLFYIQDYLSAKEYAEVLKSCWNRIEFPHQENILVLIDLFKKVKNIKLLMDKDEQVIYSELPDEITIYRGLQGKKAKVRALSWTLSLEKAKWFANRWSNKSDVYSAKINKKDIFMYENGRNEFEVVVNPTKLKNVRKLE